jgi:hypothetical protein
MTSTSTDVASLNESISNTNNSPHDDKIVNDLAVVEQSIARANDMLLHPTLEFLDTLGFLEACSARMIELIQVAAQGALSEHVLVQCLDVNDRLTQLLQASASVSLPERTPNVAAAATASVESNHQNKNSASQTIEDLLSMDLTLTLNELEVDVKPPPFDFVAAEPKATGEDDNSTEQIDDASKKDNFDDFFSERQASTENKHKE